MTNDGKIISRGCFFCHVLLHSIVRSGKRAHGLKLGGTWHHPWLLSQGPLREPRVPYFSLGTLRYFLKDFLIVEKMMTSYEIFPIFYNFFFGTTTSIRRGSEIEKERT
jgi:hypothetical protein